jgi:cysteine desulfurase / selenocysteine lyase
VSLDIARARRDTPGIRNVAHLNNAGAALPPSQVTDAVISHLRLESDIGGYEAAVAATEMIDRTYTAIGRLLGCRMDEIAVLESATRAWQIAFDGLAFKPGDRILTSRAEFASNVIAYLRKSERTGAVLEVVDDDKDGQLSVPDLRRRVDDHHRGRVALIAMSHVPTHGGLVNPAEEVGAVARHKGVPFLLDACQSVGQLQVDVERIGCDMLSGTGRKFLRGPRGTGFLYVRRDFLAQIEPPFLDLYGARWTAPDRYEIRQATRRFETWEANNAAKIGLGVAIDYALSWGLEDIQERIAGLASYLRQRLRSVDGVHVHDQGQRTCAIVTFTVDGVPARDVKRHLGEHGVNTSVSPVSDAIFDLPRRGLPDLVRASVHYYNNTEEIDRLIEAVSALRSH